MRSLSPSLYGDIAARLDIEHELAARLHPEFALDGFPGPGGYDMGCREDHDEDCDHTVRYSLHDFILSWDRALLSSHISLRPLS